MASTSRMVSRIGSETGAAHSRLICSGTGPVDASKRVITEAYFSLITI